MANTLQLFQVSQPLEASEKSAFSFTQKEDKYKLKTTFKKEQIEKVGGISGFWLFLFPVAIVLALVFGLYEAKMAESAIATFLDPMGEGKVDVSVIKLFGIGLALFAMFMGHLFADSLKGEVNEITGRSAREFGHKFYFSIAGLLAYLAFQFYLVKAASDGGQEFDSFAMVAIGVALFEILVGVLILGKAFTYLLIFAVTIQLWLLLKGMTNTARNTNNSYRDYRALRDAWNLQQPTQFQVLEGNDNIRRAIAYYSGIQLDNNPDNSSLQNETLAVPTQPVEQRPPVQTQPEPPMPNSPISQVGNTTEDEIERFINNDSDNLTF